jgi:hypothetical protein
MLVEAERSLKRNKDEDGNATWPEVVQKYARCMYFCIIIKFVKLADDGIVIKTLTMVRWSMDGAKPSRT